MVFADLSPEEKQTLLEHMEALRKSIMISVIAIIIGRVYFCFAYNERILTFIISPLRGLNESW